MLDLHRRGSLDIRALVEVLRERDLLDQIGDVSGIGNITGEAYLADLLASRGDAMPEYVERVTASSVRRELKQAAALIRAEAEDENIPVEEAIDGAERRLTTLRRNRAYNKANSLGDILQVYMPRLEGMRNGTVEPAWRPELVALRTVLDYVDAEDFLIVAARPGEGKSSWLRFEGYHRALGGQSAVIFNLENSDTEYAKGAIALHTGIDSVKLKSPRLLSQVEIQQVRDAAQFLANIPLRIITLGGPSFKDIERAAVAEINTQRASWIGVDYIQLVRNGNQSEVDNISITSQGLRAVALRYKVPVLAASQLSREIVHRGINAEPQLSDLRGSGSLEQDAKIVIMPQQIWESPSGDQLRRFPANVQPDGQLYPVIRAMPIRMHVKKNTNGPTGVTTEILWEKHTGKFLTLTDRQP